MREKTLITIAIICIITGLPALFIASRYTKTENPRILSMISGKVVEITEKDKITIIELKMDNAMPVVSFEKTKLQKGDRIEIEGELKMYKDKLEFVADKIKRK